MLRQLRECEAAEQSLVSASAAGCPLRSLPSSLPACAPMLQPLPKKGVLSLWLASALPVQCTSGSAIAGPCRAEGRPGKASKLRSENPKRAEIRARA